MKNKRKVTTAVVAGVTAVALMLGGTFAWQSINQTALNEASDVINPGGRLHDDFDGSNKDIYVENFADEPIFARIQLSEYFAIIANYGKGDAEKKNEIVGTATLENDKITNPTYAIHYFGQTNPTAEYWDWTTGGSTTFMPTFNLNKDSLAADINGIYEEGNVGTISNRDGDQYTDYTEYAEGDTETGNAIYDIDANTADELAQGGVDISGLIDGTVGIDGYTDNVTLVPEEHTAAATGTATLISMADWLALIEQNGGVYDAATHGNYWVYDTDGWVYWSAPIAAGEATGLLLDEIKLNQVMDDTWYYAINVVAQFVTADDIGKSDGTGFFSDNVAPTTEAQTLLEKIGVDMTGEAPMIDVIMLDGVQTDEVKFGKEYTVSVGQVAAYSMSSYTFSLKEEVEGITLADAKLTVAANGDLIGTTFTVVATDDAGETIEATYTVADPNIVTTDDTDYPAYALFTDDGSGAGTWAMTLVRATEVPSAEEDWYNNKPIAAVYLMTGSDEEGFDDLSYWFWYFASLDKTKVTSVYAANKIIADSDWGDAFSELTALESVDLTNVDFSNTTGLRTMFYKASSLKEVKLPDTFGVNATDIECIFMNCSSLTELDLPEGFGSKATALYGAFDGTGLLEITLPDGFGESLNDNDGYMMLFSGSENLISVTLPEEFFSANAKNFKFLFAECTSLESVNFPADFTIDGADMSYMFRACPKLKLDCSGWTVTNCTHDDFSLDSPNVTAPTWN